MSRSSELAERCNTDGAIDQYDDCYLIKVYNEIARSGPRSSRTEVLSIARPA